MPLITTKARLALLSPLIAKIVCWVMVLATLAKLVAMFTIDY